MRYRTLILIAAAVGLVAWAVPAQAGFSVRYADDNWNIRGFFGGYHGVYRHHGVAGYGYRYLDYGAFPRIVTPRYTSYWPLRRVGNLPYVPPGTIYTQHHLGHSRYRYLYGYGYPYSYTSVQLPYGYAYPGYPGYGYGGYDPVDAPLPSQYSRREQRQTDYVPPTSPVTANTQIVIQTDSEGEPRVVYRKEVKAWNRNEWQVEPQEGTTVGERVDVILNGDGEDRYDREADRDYGREDERRYDRDAEPAPRDRRYDDRREPALPDEAYTDSADSYLRLLQRGTDAMRLKAARELRRFPTARVMQALGQTLRRDGAAEVRQAAAESLGTMLARRQLDTLWEAAREDDDRAVRKAARESALKIEAFMRRR